VTRSPVAVGGDGAAAEQGPLVDRHLDPARHEHPHVADDGRHPQARLRDEEYRPSKVEVDLASSMNALVRSARKNRPRTTRFPNGTIQRRLARPAESPPGRPWRRRIRCAMAPSAPGPSVDRIPRGSTGRPRWPARGKPRRRSAPPRSPGTARRRQRSPRRHHAHHRTSHWATPGLKRIYH